MPAIHYHRPAPVNPCEHIRMTQRPDRAPLNEAEIDELESFIFSPAVSEESLDYLGIHGLLTSLAVSPVKSFADATLLWNENTL